MSDPDRYYTLKGKKAVPCDMKTWGAMFSKVDRIVQKTNVTEDISVSTVFLGSDHRFGNDGSPLIFETMIFGGVLDQHCSRYSTWDEALKDHWKLITVLLSNLLLKIGIKVPEMEGKPESKVTYYKLGYGDCVNYHRRLINLFESMYGTAPRLYIEERFFGDYPYTIYVEGNLVDAQTKLENLALIYSYDKWISREDASPVRNQPVGGKGDGR
jgi:hypothetical protein